LAFVYALFWMWRSDRALSKGNRVAAFFHAGTSALIAGSLIWETTVRFHVLAPSVSSALVVVAALALLFVAWKRDEHLIAWIAAAMTTVTCIGLAIGTADLVPPVLATALVGVAATRLSIDSLTLSLAVVSNCLALPLIMMTVVGQGWHGIAVVEGTLVVFAVLWLSTLRAEAVAAVFVGLSGAALLAKFHHGHANEVALISFALAAIAFTVSVRRRSIAFSVSGAIAAAIASLLVIPLAFVGSVWSAAMLVAALVAKRTAWPAMEIQSACWGAAAVAVAIQSAPALLVVAFSAVAAVRIAQQKLILLFVASAAAVAAVLAMLPNSALTRTAVLAFAAVVLSLLSRLLPTARTVAWALLVLGGVKLIIDDLPAGHATTMVAALALYGGAMLIVARRPTLTAPQ